MLMALRGQSTTRTAFSRFVSVSVCLCAFLVLPFPQLTVLTCGAPAETESSSQEERESAEEELVVCPAAGRNLNDRRHIWSHDNRDPLHQIAAYAAKLPVIVGHRLANGLCAPLLI